MCHVMHARTHLLGEVEEDLGLLLSAGLDKRRDVELALPLVVRAGVFGLRESGERGAAEKKWDGVQAAARTPAFVRSLPTKRQPRTLTWTT